MKKCRKCEKNKKNAEFAKRTASEDGLQSWCRVCTKKYDKRTKEEMPKKRKPSVASQVETLQLQVKMLTNHITGQLDPAVKALLINNHPTWWMRVKRLLTYDLCSPFKVKTQENIETKE